MSDSLKRTTSRRTPRSEPRKPQSKILSEADSEGTDSAASIDHDDSPVRRLLRLLANLSAPAGDPDAAKRALLSGVARAIDASTWSWALTRTPEPGAPQSIPIPIARLDGGWTTEQQAIHVRAQQSPHRRIFGDILFTEFLRTGQATYRRQDMLDDARWRGSAFYQEFVGPMQLDDFILSAYRVTASDVSAIAFYRRVGAPPFSQEDRRMVELLTLDVGWLHRDTTPADATGPVVTLAPRERQVLSLLITGDGRKQIAAKLGISEHTVGGYQKAIYRHFNVASRGELQAKFLGGEARA